MYFSDWTYRKIISSFLSILAIVLQHNAHANQWLYLTQTLRAVFKPALQWQYPNKVVSPHCSFGHFQWVQISVWGFLGYCSVVTVALKYTRVPCRWTDCRLAALLHARLLSGTL